MNDSCSTVVVGISSPNGDDQFGWAVVDRLAKSQHNDVSFRKINNPVDLVAELETHERVLVVDAGMGLPQTVPLLTLAYKSAADRKIVQELPPGSTHDIGLDLTLRMAESLGKPTDHVSLWIGRGTTFDRLGEMSSSTRAAVDLCAAAIKDFLSNCRDPSDI